MICIHATKNYLPTLIHLISLTRLIRLSVDRRIVYTLWWEIGMRI